MPLSLGWTLMKNLCRKERIHPSPSGGGGGGGSGDVMAVLRLLPAAILTLTAVMEAEDREVLAYLMTQSMSGPAAGEQQRRCRMTAHGAAFDCGCFHCYTSFWSRWDCSSKRELIHQAIEAFEDHLESSGRGRRRDRSRSDKGKKKKEKEGKGKDVRMADAEVEPKVEEGGDGFSLEEEGADDDWVDAAAEQQEEEEEEECSAACGERRRGWPDVIGLFNSRLWSLWGTTV